MRVRSLFLGVVGVCTATVLVGQVRQFLADPHIWPPDDFVEYWAAARLTLNGHNPYEESLLVPLQQFAGRNTNEAIMMWNPPWSLTVVLPLGWFPPRTAQLLWLFGHVLIMGFCADRLWQLAGGPLSFRWVGWISGFFFLPTIFALASGQISPLLVFGVVLFFICWRKASTDRRWEYAAGAATILVAIKPHLAYLLWVGLAIEAVLDRRWRVIVGGATMGMVCAAIPLVTNPSVWHQYAEAMTHRPPAQWLSPTWGTVLRLIGGAEYFRLQFVPVIVGLLVFAWYRYRLRQCWHWLDQLPFVLLLSFVTAPYGAWPFDMVLLLPVVMVLIVRSIATWASSSSRWILAGLLAINGGCLVLNLCQVGSFWFLWVSPAILILYVLHRHFEQDRGKTRPVAAPSITPAVVLP
ncbi:MAG: glycosyltransferase family 87 protein [Gemmataceae bacterium]|nr:DUF2029 domain-containing protein [Gemmata sp.]MDW8196599.1 glycosyltransferase family 87 protein [Gemmataceae bacterium]